MSIDVRTEEQQSRIPQSVREKREYLRRVIEQISSRYKLPRDEDGILHVLSVGCLYAYEGEPVLSIFPNSDFKGIEIDERRIELAQRTNRDLSRDRVKLEVEDGREVNTEEVGRYGLVIIRNPQLMGSISERGTTPEDWQRIFEASAKKTAAGGWLLITVEDSKYAEIAMQYLYKNKVMPVYSWSNPVQSPKDMLFDDPIIIIGQK